MVEIIIIIFGLFAGIHMFLEKRSWLNPGTIFMFYWIIVVFMANFIEIRDFAAPELYIHFIE